MSPELLDEHSNYGREVDVYSFAIVVNEMLTRELPWRALKPGRHNLIEAVLFERRRPDIPLETPVALREIVEACWEHDPADRPVRIISVGPTRATRYLRCFSLLRNGARRWLIHTLNTSARICSDVRPSTSASRGQATRQHVV